MKHFNLAITLSQSNKQAIISFYQHRLIKTQFIDFQFVTSQGGPKNVNVHFSLRIRYQPWRLDMSTLRICSNGGDTLCNVPCFRWQESFFFRLQKIWGNIICQIKIEWLYITTSLLSDENIWARIVISYILQYFVTWNMTVTVLSRSQCLGVYEAVWSWTINIDNPVHISQYLSSFQIYAVMGQQPSLPT